VIGIEKRQVAVEQPLVEGIERADEFEKLKLLVRIVGTAYLDVEIVKVLRRRRGMG
jgi:hypothetical protein